MAKEKIAISKIKANVGQIDGLKPNPRVIKDDKLQKLVRSLQETPELLEHRGLLVFPYDGGKKYVTIGGNQRLAAAKEAGFTEIWCEVLDGDTSVEKLNEYLIKDNAAFGEWDFDMLLDDWDVSDLGDWGLDLPVFDEEGGEDDGSVNTHTAEVEEDNAPEVSDSEPFSKTGDLWQIGRHRLICGDSTDAETYNSLMTGEKAVLCFTDPPYGYNYQSNMRTKSKKFEVLANDDRILPFIEPLKSHVDGFVFVCASWKTLDAWYSEFKGFYALTNLIIWDKGGGGMGDLKGTFSTDFECILVANNGAEIKGKRIGSVWAVGKDGSSTYVHPTQKPVALIAQALNSTTIAGDLVIDPFGGSGSTLIACEQLGRTCYTIELDPKYCDVIVKRYMALVGDSECWVTRNGERKQVTELDL